MGDQGRYQRERAPGIDRAARLRNALWDSINPDPREGKHAVGDSTALKGWGRAPLAGNYRKALPLAAEGTRFTPGNSFPSQAKAQHQDRRSVGLKPRPFQAI